MDDLHINHDSFFGNSANGGAGKRTIENAERLRAEMFRERRRMRELVEKSDFTRAQRAVIKALVDHWFQNRGKGGVIHPGRERLAKKARCTVKTVSRTLDVLRALGAIEAVSNINGYGQEATRYKVHEDCMRVALGGSKCPTTIHCGQKSPTKWRDIMSHSLIDTDVNEKSPSQDVKFGNVVPFIGKGC